MCIINTITTLSVNGLVNVSSDENLDGRTEILKAYLYMTASALISTSPTHCWNAKPPRELLNGHFGRIFHLDRAIVPLLPYLGVLELGQVFFKVTFNKLQQGKHQTKPLFSACKECLGRSGLLISFPITEIIWSSSKIPKQLSIGLHL